VKKICDHILETVGGTPKETADYMQAEVERWNKVIKAANVKLQ